MMRTPILLLALLAGCQAAQTVPATESRTFDLQGHRGARGYLPENTIPSFLLALDLGVTTLEADVVVSADGEVVVSHDPWFSAAISSLPSGEPVSEEEEREHLLYEMTYAEITGFDVGLRGNPRFPEQKPMAVIKPRLVEVFARAEAYAEDHGYPAPRYNIEIKSNPDWDGVMTPAVEEFAALVVEVIEGAGVGERCVIQSFDVRALQELHAGVHGIELSLLVEQDEDRGIAHNLELLGFTPDVYSPDHRLVNKVLVDACRARGMRIVPWTVNERARMEELVEDGVDGIITDYPDRGKALIRQ